MPRRRIKKTTYYVTGTFKIPVTVYFCTGLRRLRINLDPEGNVIAHAPIRTTLSDIDRFVESNLVWIEKQKIKLEKKIHLPYIDSTEQRRKARVIKARASAFLSVYDGKLPEKIYVRNMSSRWGSCSSLGNISLNVYLLEVEPELFEYVLIHELSHLYHMNHSPKFWAQVAKYCPDYKEKRRKLKMYEIPKKKEN